MTSNKRTLQTDRDNAKWLGVCAGIAKFLDVQPWTVRVVFLGCILFGGWPLIPGYFVAWYLMDNNSGKVRDAILDNQAVKHFRSVDYRKKLYRDPQHGKVGGVCAGIADYLEIDVAVVRVVYLVLTVVAGFPVLLYLGAMFVLDKKPAEEYRWTRRRRTESAQPAGSNPRAGAQPAYSAMDSEDPARRSSRRYSSDEEPPLRDQYSQRREFQYCARKFATLQQRLVRLEAYVTSNKFKLQREFKSMS